MGHPETNRYRSGAKNPHQEVLVASLGEGSYASSVFGQANLRIQHKVIGQLTGNGGNDTIEH